MRGASLVHCRATATVLTPEPEPVSVPEPERPQVPEREPVPGREPGVLAWRRTPLHHFLSDPFC